MGAESVCPSTRIARAMELVGDGVEGDAPFWLQNGFPAVEDQRLGKPQNQLASHVENLEPRQVGLCPMRRVMFCRMASFSSSKLARPLPPHGAYPGWG